jgi:spore coat assembly protein
MSKNNVRVGDIVTRKSYGNDMLFRITELNVDGEMASLMGLDYRLLADAPLDDLVKLDPDEMEKRRKEGAEREQASIHAIQQERRTFREKNTWRAVSASTDAADAARTFDWPGKVLHLDGDANFLRKCLLVYRELKISVDGYYLAEKDFPENVIPLLQKHRPDILVVTGHDAFQAKRGPAEDLNNYRNSKFFIQTVEKARVFQQNKDSLVIFAGACQSHFEALLAAGANFASSPKRINIHALDPVYIAEKVAYTSIQQPVNLFEMIKNTVTGIDGVGGLETRGCFRFGIPRIK